MDIKLAKAEDVEKLRNEVKNLAETGVAGNGNHFGICTDSRNTLAKTVTVSDSELTLTDGLQITVRFDHGLRSTTSDEGATTLNINGTGDKELYVNGADNTTVENSNALLYLDYGGVITIAYNAISDTYAIIGKEAFNGGGTGTPGKDGKSAYEIAVANGFKGSEAEWLNSLKGDTGPQGAQGPKGDTGAQGEKGEKGPQGDTGEKGDKGEQGATGANGYTPVKGVDYWTEEDQTAIKTDMETYLAEELAKRGQLKPEYANSIEGCTDTSKLYVLPDGYIYAYMKTEVEYNAYTNLLPFATDADRTTIYNGKGYKENTRLSSSSGSTGDADGIFATGFIPATSGDVLRFENIDWSTNATQKTYVIAYDSSNTPTGTYTIEAGLAATTTKPASPLSLDSATFGSGFNAIRISATDISEKSIITINEEIKESTTFAYAWSNTGHAFIPADYEERIRDCEEKITSLTQEVEYSSSTDIIPMVQFTYDHELKDVSGDVSKFKLSSHDIRKQNTVPTVYELFDNLVESYPDFVSKVDAAELAGLEYPEYANGITIENTYLVTPAYKTYMYQLTYANGASGNSGRHKKKKLLLIGGLDGSEYGPPYNLYIFAKNLCEKFLEDENLFKLRSAFDVYIVPCLNGYGLYHGTKYNANGIAITRNFPVKNWVEADVGNPNYYTGSVAGSEFETKIVMNLTDYLKPDIAIDHHSYGHLETQFYSELPREEFVKLAYQCLVDCSCAFIKSLPEYFGTEFKLLQYSSGATSAPANVNNLRGTQTWWDENGVTFGGLVEMSVCINYSSGAPNDEGVDHYGNDTFAVAEYTLRNQLLRYCQYVLGRI